MDWNLEDFDQSRIGDEIDRLLHQNFKPEEKVNPKDLGILKTSDSFQAQALKNKYQGDIGEGTAIRVASEKMNMIPDPRFDQCRRGFDEVCRDENGRLVVIESKFADKGIHALNGDQMQPSWIERKIDQMSTPGNELYSTGNAEIANEITKEGVFKIRRIIISTDPGSLEAKVYEGQDNGKWKLIDQWSVIDLEQPYLE